MCVVSHICRERGVVSEFVIDHSCRERGVVSDVCS